MRISSEGRCSPKQAIGRGLAGAILLVAISVVSCKNAVVPPVILGNGETAMSSPILKLGEQWSGNMSGLADVTATFDTTTNTVRETIKNVSGRKLCWGLSEPHMKLGAATVGELGPHKLGHLLPGQQVDASIAIMNDPKYTGYKFDGYVLHLEVYDCNGGAPPPY